MQTIIMVLNNQPFAEGFGFNGNILETNILNLAVVWGVVVSLGGDTLKSLLQNRKQTISNKLKEAEKRAQEAKEKLTEAQSQFESAQKKGVEIRQQGDQTAERKKQDSANEKKKEIARLTTKKEETLRVEEQKAVFQVYEQLVKRVMGQVENKLTAQLDSSSSSHASLINFQIVFFARYKPST